LGGGELVYENRKNQVDTRTDMCTGGTHKVSPQWKAKTKKGGGRGGHWEHRSSY